MSFLLIAGKFKCREVWPQVMTEQLFNWMLLVLLLLIPFLIMLFTYTLVSRVLCDSNLFVETNSIGRNFRNGVYYSKMQRGSIVPDADTDNKLSVKNTASSSSSCSSFPASSVAVSFNCRSGEINLMNDRLSDTFAQSRINLAPNDGNQHIIVKSRIG